MTYTSTASGGATGDTLSGSGSINGLVFLRGSPHDYDRWAQAGARGWAYADVLPVFNSDCTKLMWTSTRDGQSPAQLYIADFVPPKAD